MKSTLPGMSRGSWFANLRMGVKLTLALGLLFVLMLVLGLTALWAMHGARKGSAHLVTARLPQLDASVTVERDTYEAMLNFTAYALSGDEAEYSGGRQSLARIKEAAARLRVLSLDALGEDDEGGGAFALAVDAMGDAIDRFDVLAEQTRTLIHNKERAWASFNAALAEVDRAFLLLRAINGTGTERFKELVDLQGDFHALRAAISTALASESGMTLSSLHTDFLRFSSRLTALWRQSAAAYAEEAARPESSRARQAPPPALDVPLEEEELLLLQAMNDGRAAMSTLTAELDTARGLALERRDSAAKIALLARDMSREAMGELRSEMDGGLSFLTMMAAVFIVLLFFAAGGCLFLFLAFSRGIIRPLEEISAFAKKAAEGESTSTLPFTRADELGELAHSLRALAGAQREAVSRMQHKEREAEQKKREAERITEKAEETLRAVKKREQEIVALVTAIRERDKAAFAAPPAVPAPSVLAEKAAPPAAGRDAAAPVPVAAAPLPAGAPPAVAGAADAAPDTAAEHARESDEALRDLAELSAGMHKLIRQLADK